MIEPQDRHPARRQDGRDRPGPARAGISGADVLVVLIIVFLTTLVILMLLSRGREHARMASCQNNLAHVGRALALYDHLEHKLPTVPHLATLDTPATSLPKSPLRAMLEALVQPNLLGITDDKTPPPPRPGEVPGERPVPGFVCSSDPNATSGQFPAPNSYRACTGDGRLGENGAFQPGRAISLKEVEERDGLSYTAAFSERLVGDNLANHAAARNYTIPRDRILADTCPGPPDLSSWRGDAGSSWVSSDYRSTLYNHALPPGAQSSCIESSGRTALMGASSGHVRGVNMLLLDGRVMVVLPSINTKIWKEFARIGATDANSAGP